MDRYPKIQLEIIMSEKLLSCNEDEIDFAIRASFGPMADSSHKSIFLQDLGMDFYVSPKYIKKYGEPKHPDELKDHKLLVPRIHGDGVNLKLQQKNKKKIHKYELKGSLLSQDFVFLEEMCVEGAGIYIGSPNTREKKKLVPILKDWKSPGKAKLFLLHPDRPLTPKAQVFKDFIKGWFRN